MSKDNTSKQNISWPWITFVAGAVSLIPFLFPGLQHIFSYDRAAITDFWRLFTSHWIHWNADHLFWSLGTFLLMGWICEKRNRTAFIFALTVGAGLIPLALYFLQPELRLYGGLSGLDCTLFGLAAVGIIREKIAAREWLIPATGVLLLIAFLGKVTYEFTTSGTLFVGNTTGMTPVPLAHIVGVGVGILTAMSESMLNGRWWHFGNDPASYTPATMYQDI